MRFNELFSRVALFSLTWTGSAISAELPAWFIEVPDSIETLLVADTSAAKLFEYTQNANGTYTLAEYYMSIGQRGVGKARAGDRKTPLGNYFVVDQLDTSRLDPKYGVTAFPLDYPNVMDRRAGRTGDGIWLHGVLPGGERRPERDTDGCIALPNENLADLATRLELNRTPVLVTRKVRYASADETESIRSALLARIAAWRDALAAGDVIDYLSRYAPDFSYRGLDRDEWAAFRAAQLNAARAIAVDDILILLDPEDPELAITRFEVSVSGSDGNAAVTKRLYWRRFDAGEWLIVAEDNG